MAVSDKTIAFLLTRGVEQVELTSPRAALDEAGAKTVLISPSEGTLQAMEGDWDHAEVFDVDVPLAEANAADYDALVLPGGTINADTLRTDDDAVAFVKAFFDADKPVAAICHAPWILAEAGVAKGRKLTSFESTKVDLENAGADWTDAEVVVDGNLITSRNPGDLDAFNEAISEKLS
ncbi:MULTISPECIES: type 1 glutamine amidotransferase domain-containing protein [Brevibacterium]|uniref:Peptidase C56 n=1 Tax=Brevibacterium casei TaxID=33889 RepID=A0A269ZCU5_9MICO|nr:type 1 glutamine amidotransferase domain-containing protein [Brevibacterium casei]NJE66585.1 type 1 glutamine amidotransferase [Brevibacterium sp. LS14]SIH12068.1 intracellular protease 1 [Mycobacteroides abscessus subsp. abscessus]MBE4696337.1 type 1 glutamine amidotransferase [Brevibacterium casei]MBY3579459.1 type 1 glutamine amidotransferase [Brevibacterium casei]PAK95421.1 peptidase C56 [Brevibacterium casei]